MTHESIQVEWDCALAEDHNSFEMHRMMARTDQMLHIAMATDSQIYTRDSETKPMARQDSGIVTETKPHSLLLFL